MEGLLFACQDPALQQTAENPTLQQDLSGQNSITIEMVDAALTSLASLSSMPQSEASADQSTEQVQATENSIPIQLTS
jgi:hypothetical protein